ncbi:MAG: tRNA-dihydrouridine synthase family protein, partial [Phycisphaerales bacterium]|nr:tRNA-dihydrouridine synthase family protein [Phycisphaerales bacterium]
MQVRPLQLGPGRLETNLMLAPIAGFCDLAFRLTCRAYGGVGLACTDLLSPQGLLRGTRTSLDLARTTAEDQQIGMQLYGCDPTIMAEGAKWAVDHGATVVDINMGCPVDKVTKKDGGSKLMCDLDSTTRMTARVRASMPDTVPLTAKMRLGWSESDARSNTAGRLASRLIEVGVCGVTVHGRTTEQKFKGACSLEGIREVVEHVHGRHPGVPVIGNGDCREPEDVARMLRGTGCDGVMIGRGALSTPWLFRDAWALLTTGEVPQAPDDVEKIEMVRTYFERMREFRTDHYAMVQIRRRMTWFAKRINGSH